MGTGGARGQECEKGTGNADLKSVSSAPLFALENPSSQSICAI